MSNTALLGSYASQAGTGLTFKNRLINGDMKISQRFGTANAAVAVSTVVYTTDRWLCYLLGAGGTASQVTASVAGHTKALKLVPSAGNTYASFVQRIESVNIEDLANSAVAFSGWVYVDNATGVTATVEAYVPTAIDNYAGSTQITITNPTINITSGSYVYFEKQITLPANATNGLQVAVVFTGAASKDLRFTGASLEAGPTATPFERRPIGVELALAQRYYYKVDMSQGTSVKNVSGFCIAGQGHASIFVTPPVTMRTSANLSHNLADNQFVTSSPIGAQWSFIQDGNAFATKTGTAVFTPNAASLVVYGASWSITGRPLFGPGVLLAYDAEL